MHKKFPILIFILITSLILLAILGVRYGKHSKKEFSETLTIRPDRVTEIQLSNLTGNYRSTKDPEKIKFLLNYLDQVQYKRLMNDQTAYMPKRASIIYLYEDKKSNFIVPYEKEAMIDYKVYQVKDGSIEQSVLLKFYDSLSEE